MNMKEKETYNWRSNWSLFVSVNFVILFYFFSLSIIIIKYLGMLGQGGLLLGGGDVVHLDPGGQDRVEAHQQKHGQLGGPQGQGEDDATYQD